MILIYNSNHKSSPLFIVYKPRIKKLAIMCTDQILKWKGG